MSICANCTQLLPIDVCATSIIIGTVLAADTEYNIYFRCLANDFLIKYTATSDENGLLTLVPEYPFVFAVGVGYEVWVNTTSYSECGDRIDFCSQHSTCYSVEFVRITLTDTAPETNVQTFKTVDCC